MAECEPLWREITSFASNQASGDHLLTDPIGAFWNGRMYATLMQNDQCRTESSLGRSPATSTHMSILEWANVRHSHANRLVSHRIRPRTIAYCQPL